MSIYLDLEIIHSLPFSNSNRDDAGLPKSVIVGGTQRGRISSQSLKRSARYYGAEKTHGFTGTTGDSSFVRTRHLHNLITAELTARNAPQSTLDRVTSLFNDKSPLGQLSTRKTGEKQVVQNALVVITQEEVTSLANLIMEHEKPANDLIESVLLTSSKRDLALWGRFFASSTEATLDGAAQVAHAITTHAINLEPDFYVAVDDAQHHFTKSRGAGYPSENFFSHGVFYKYANVNLHEAAWNLLGVRSLGGELTLNQKHALTETELNETITQLLHDFVRSFVLSVPTGKIRSTAHQTLPDFVRVTLRNDRPVTGATAFDTAITAKGNQSILENSMIALSETHEDVQAFIQEPILSKHVASRACREYATGLGDRVARMEDLTDGLESVISQVTREVLNITQEEPVTKKTKTKKKTNS